MGSSITGRCNDARSEEMDFTLWFNFDSYYDFGELLSILIILVSFPWHEDTPKHNIMSECGRCELSFWSRLASRSISRLIISSNPHISWMEKRYSFSERKEESPVLPILSTSPPPMPPSRLTWPSFWLESLLWVWFTFWLFFQFIQPTWLYASTVFAALLTLARHLDFGYCLWPLLWGHAVTSTQLAIPALVAVSHC